MAGTSVISLHGVSARMGGTTILRDVDLEVAGGEAIGLFGANGAGKTTLLRLVATQLRPVGGEAFVLGVNIATDERLAVRHRIGLIGHTPALQPELTVGENLGFAAALSGIDAEAIGDALATVGLAGATDRPVAACSYGMQRRTEFARELMLRPDLLLLDEPHSALDGAAADLVAHLTDSVTAAGGAAVLVSHDRERVAKLVGRTVEVSAGRVS